jgi:SAM-dependent methyltransferase
MGLCYPDTRSLWETYLSGKSFQRTLLIGHQRLFLHPSEVDYFKRKSGKELKSIAGYAFGDYSDEFLRELLGIERLSVLDFSDYEGADVIHDLNFPVPDHLISQFDAVIDAGTLEHVFNFPIAISNLMRMVKVGGRIFIATPANNQCGHGFYQFSPELMFRIFSPANGFEIDRVSMYEADYPSIELSENHVVYDVNDPADVRSRVGIVSSKPVTMIVEAVKTADVPPFETPPLQSDYVATWNADGTAQNSESTAKRVARKLGLLNRAIGHREKAKYSFSNKHFYKRREL